MTKISEFFLLASVSTLFIGEIPIIGSVKTSGFLLLISFLFFVIAICKKEINIFYEKQIIKYILLSVLFIIIGTISSFIIFKNVSHINTIKGYLYLFINFLIFTQIILLSKNNGALPKKILWCFLFSLSQILFIYIPEINKYFLYNDYRFNGLLSNPNYFSNFQIIPTLFLLFLLIDKNYKIIIRIIISILFCFSVGLIIWSGSRSGLLGLIMSLISLIVLIIPILPRKKLAGIVFLIIISFPLGYLIIPKISHDNIISRISDIQTRTTKSGLIESNTTVISVLNKVSGEQDRLNIWKNSLPFIVKNPLGYGNEYKDIIDIKGDGLDHRESHNFELQLLLTGGIGLFLIINFALLKIVIESIKNCYKKKFNEMHILLPILIGIFVSSMFLDPLSFRSIWVIMAIIIVYNRQLSN